MSAFRSTDMVRNAQLPSKPETVLGHDLALEHNPKPEESRHWDSSFLSRAHPYPNLLFELATRLDRQDED